MRNHFKSPITPFYLVFILMAVATVITIGFQWILLWGLVYGVFILLVFRVLTKRTRAIEKISEQSKVQTAAMESAANGVIITDTRGIVEWVNPAFTRLTGYTFEETVGYNLKKLNSGQQSPEFFRDMWATILAGEVWHNEVVNKRKDGTLYTEEMTITPVFDESQKIARFVAIKQDISERKELEELAKLEKERMAGELDVARDIQMSMLPLKFPPFPDREDIDIQATLIPAREVGGDFYDFFWIDEENLCFVVGDVSGKGVPAALMMAVTKTLIKSVARQEKSTARILSKVNDEISRDNDNNMFITVFLAILNTTTGYLVYTNAGHNPSYILGKQKGELRKLSDLHGVVLGAMEEFEYKESVIRMDRGEILIAYTDGITEARNKSNDLYSDERFFNLLQEHPFAYPWALIQRVIDDIRIHEAGADPADDITILSIEFKEQTNDSVLDYLFTSIPNELSHIRLLIDQFEVFAKKHDIPKETVQQIDIVFDELLSNTIKYAYPGGNAHEIEIKIRFYQERLTVTLLDDGIPYNPFDRMTPDTTLEVPDREIGGLGVHLVKFLVDDYHYEYKTQIKRNSVHFVKHI